MTDLRPPARSTFPAGDWKVLASFWHPIAFSSEVSSTPKKMTLLDVDLVAVRVGGRLVVARDACPHRGTRMSLGSVRGDRFVCAYHGIEYGADGRAVRVPGTPEDFRIPRRLCLQTYLAEEKYGIVWTCLAGTPLAPLPEWPILDDPAVQKTKLSVPIECGAGRHIENFCDTSHFPFTHRVTFGCPDAPEIPRYEVEEREHGLFASIMTIQQDGSLTFDEPDYAEVISDYTISMPYCAELILRFPRGDEFIYDIVSPVSNGRCHVFMWKTRDHDLGDAVDDWIQFQVDVNEEDRLMVEGERPSELPVDARLEVHLPADGLSLSYRQLWKRYGLDGPEANAD